MKKSFTLFAALFMAANAFAYVGGDTITLDLTKPTSPASYTFSSGIWENTHDASTANQWLQFQVFKISHDCTGNAYYGSSYWDGFTLANSGDTSDAGNGNSTTWSQHQDGCMAGGGVAVNANGTITKLSGTTAASTKGNPYLVGYWSAFGGAPNVVKFAKVNGDSVFEAVGVYVSNHPWPYYEMKNGDSFARAFNKEGDSFKVIAHGVLRGVETKTDSLELDSYNNGTLNQVTDWKFFNLSSLGNVSSIFFTLSSTDSGEWGINTSTYFCMDKLQVKVIPTTGVNKVDENAVRIYFDRAAQEVVAADGAQVNIFNMQGQLVLSATGSHVSLASLADGLYIVKSAGQTLKITK
ncbi:MAG: DUF4465 domain-containing protein [Muribaculaceae bacterium]|jgi:hypothetical protein|nr:DUF4465 domain-containing protein [Muribaculaceae bacterium]